MLRKLFSSFGLVLVLLAGLVVLSGCSNSVSNESAVTDEDNRYLTIVNDTGEVINKVQVYVNDGTELKSFTREDVDDESISYKMSSSLAKHKSFTIKLTDNFDEVFIKKVKVNKKGNTEVVVTFDDCTNDDDLSIRFNKLFN